MSDDESIEQEPAVEAGGVGARLKRAREAAGLELAQVAAETRIPQRHLLTIENGALADLPARTYAVGFSRTYARLVGLDEREIVDQVRIELAEGEDRGAAPTRFEPGDPARIPGRGLAWFALFAAVLLVGGIYAFYRSYFAPGLGPAPLQNPATQVWTGRPYALAITVGGRPVPKLSEEDEVIKDVPVTAAALLARAPRPAAADEPPANGG